MMRQTLGYRLLYLYVRWVFTACYSRRFVVEGRERVPTDRPVLLVTTHQNNLPDALAVLFASARNPVFVARADFFRPPLVARIFRFLRMLPMYRADHGRAAIRSKLPATMRQLEAHLEAGGACAIMAEGGSVPVREVRRLKKGWARLVLDVLPTAPDLAVVPVAIEYSDWQDWGPDIRVRFGEPIAFAPVEYEEEVPRQLNAMNEQMHAALAAMVEDDEAIAAWHRAGTTSRRGRDGLWRILGAPVLLLIGLAVLPVILFARYRAKADPRPDFKSTIEVVVMTVATPIWALVLGLASTWAFGGLAFVLGALAVPVLLWMAARTTIAWTVR
ncbi:MAG: 1-acyl-sn-glycerol-3-phosphate acyltransferase [Bacteroidota bacterium]